MSVILSEGAPLIIPAQLCPGNASTVYDCYTLEKNKRFS